MQAGCKILITGFGPFPGVRSNPSQWLIQSIDSGALHLPADASVSTAVLPTSWHEVAERLPDLLALYRPDIALHFGVHGRTTGIRIEQMARNQTKHLPDVDGMLPPCKCIDRNGGRTLRTPVTGQKLIAPLRALGLKAELSNDAGGYLCNMLFYLSLLELRKKNPQASSLFVHIPRVQTAIDKRDLIKGAETIIRGCAKHAKRQKQAVLIA